MKKFIFILLFAFGCNSGGVKESKDIPEWFYEVKPSNINLIYGTGASSIKDDAINGALSSAVAVIKTNVSSTVSTDSQIINGKLSESMRVQAVNEVERFSLSGYEVTKLEYVKKSKMYYAEVTIDKNKIYMEKLDEYNTALAEVKTMYEDAKASATVISSLQFAKTLDQKAEGLKKDASVLRALNPSFGYAAALNELSAYQNYKNQLLSQIGFVVSGGNSDINNTLNSVITKKNLRTEGKNKVRISYSLGDTSKSHAYRAFLSKTNITVKISDLGGELSKASNFSFGGTSYINETEAYKESLKDLARKFDEMLNEVL